MLFNSTVFIMCFLPAVLAGWYLLKRMKSQVPCRIFLLGMSLFFYGYYNTSYLWILAVSLLANYLISFLLEKNSAAPVRRLLTGTGFLVNLGLLFYFKYFNFFIDNCNFFFHTDITVEKIALPLGISFFTFQQLSFLIERHRGNAQHYGFLEYGCFITFFPQLVAGPIVLHDEFIPQLRDSAKKKFSSEEFLEGSGLFILGLAKKVLLADVLGIIVNAEYANIAYLDAPAAWVTIVCYMLELYFDFSGYCDMARGLGRMFGFVLPENFNSPLQAVSVRDFWRRWHMTLSRFFTAYIYIPMGGNRKGKARQCLNLLTVFFVSGVWHGANWTFIVWGLMHGLAAVWETAFPKLRFRQEWIMKLLTGIYVTLTFSIFRSDSLKSAALLWKKLFAGGRNGMFLGLCNVLKVPENYLLREALELLFPELLNPMYVVTLILLLGISLALICGKRAKDWLDRYRTTKRGLFVLAVLFVWSLISLSQVSTFLYFNF